MAWTAPRTWTTGELVTAAFMNTHLRDNLTFLKGAAVASTGDATRTFTSTSYLDLDALTGGSGTLSAVAASVVSDTLIKVEVGALVANSSAGATTRVSYRVSGATTTAASDAWQFMYESSAADDQLQASYTSYQTVTAGTNTVEVQARVNAGTGTVGRVFLIVTPL